MFPKITDVKRPMDTPVRLVNGTHAAGSLLCTHSTVTDPCETLAFFYGGPCFKIYLALTCIIPSFYDDPCIIPSFNYQAFLSSEIDRFWDIFDFRLAAPSQKQGSSSPAHNWVSTILRGSHDSISDAAVSTEVIRQHFQRTVMRDSTHEDLLPVLENLRRSMVSMSIAGIFKDLMNKQIGMTLWKYSVH